jgi:hypothetical protein
VTRLASVERRESEYVVTSYTQTPPGFRQMNGHFSRVPEGAVSELGQRLLAALDASNRITLTDVDASADSFAPALDALGLKSYAQYMKGAISVSLEIDNDDVLRITPMRNGGAAEGFVEINERSRPLEDRSADSVGAAVEEAMAQARPHGS